MFFLHILCRYKDQLFLTWNRSKDELDTFLKTITEQHQHLQLETFVHKCIPFLNAYIENDNGQLRTCVYHPPQIQKYTLPYVVGHSKLKHTLWFRSALIRAVRFCSNLTDFQQEQIYLEMTCLANGYSIDFIETQLKHFYRFFHAEETRYSLDQSTYEQFRRRSFDFIIEQHKTADNKQKLEDNNHVLYFSYPYDYGPYNQFNEKFLAHWAADLKDDPKLPSKDIKIILNTKHIYSLNALLAQQKPSDELLKA